MGRPRIGEMLVEQGRIDAIQLRSALSHQRRWGGRLGRAIVTLGFLPERALLEAVGKQLGAPFVEIGDRLVPPRVLALVPAKLVRARKVLPLARLSEHRRGPLVVAFPDPGDLRVVDEVEFASGLAVRPLIAAEDDLDRAIARHLDGVVLLRDARPEDREDAIDLVDEVLANQVVRGQGKWQPN